MDAGPLIFLAAIFAVMWFFLIRPQRRRRAAHVELVSGIAPDDEVVTAGGVYGRVRSVADDHIVLEIAPGTEIRVVKDAVTGVVPKGEEPASEQRNPR
jgi:preprotein translocase subunit YajC